MFIAPVNFRMGAAIRQRRLPCCTCPPSRAVLSARSSRRFRPSGLDAPFLASAFIAARNRGRASAQAVNRQRAAGTGCARLLRLSSPHRLQPGCCGLSSPHRLWGCSSGRCAAAAREDDCSRLRCSRHQKAPPGGAGYIEYGPPEWALGGSRRPRYGGSRSADRAGWFGSSRIESHGSSPADHAPTFHGIPTE